MKTHSIEIRFPLEVDLPDDFEQQLVTLVSTVCNKYEREYMDRTMWVMGVGCKMVWSPMDAAMLGPGHAVDPNLAPGEEPRFDEGTLELMVSERERYEDRWTPDDRFVNAVREDLTEKLKHAVRNLVGFEPSFKQMTLNFDGLKVEIHGTNQNPDQQS